MNTFYEWIRLCSRLTALWRYINFVLLFSYYSYFQVKISVRDWWQYQRGSKRSHETWSSIGHENNTHITKLLGEKKNTQNIRREKRWRTSHRWKLRPRTVESRNIHRCHTEAELHFVDGPTSFRYHHRDTIRPGAFRTTSFIIAHARAGTCLIAAYL